MTTPKTSTRSGTRGGAPTRRGNAMILVAGILVLLVIVATAYITRTQSGRVTSVAVQQASSGDTNERIIADMLASEISGALFPRPVDPFPDPAFPEYWWPAGIAGIADANAPRLSPLRNPVRYGVDQDAGPDGVLNSGDEDGWPDYPYNVALEHVVPWTNWPDGGNGLWPQGPGTPSGVTFLLEGNPFGQPGFGDCRWARDLEPLRWDTQDTGLWNPSTPAVPLPGDRADAFLYWRHLTNIARPDNGWRVVKSINDVTNELNLGGGIVRDLNIPVEQWPVGTRPRQYNFSLTGDAVFPGADTFNRQWSAWLGTPASYSLALRDQNNVGMPTNRYNLKDLNGNGIVHEYDPNPALLLGERPQDEFEPGTPRWHVSRRLADTDGDGYTDSYWFLAPTPIERGIRQIVAVSVVDNQGMLNVNGAAGFVPGTIGGLGPTATAGETPVDLAASGQQLEWDILAGVPAASWNVGFFDAPHNWEGAFDYPTLAGPYSGFAFGQDYPLYNRGVSSEVQIAWDSNSGNGYARWNDFVDSTGVGLNPLDEFPQRLATALERRRYWLNGASRPFDPGLGLTPFGVADEVELRMYHGQNYPWIFSRFERTMNTIKTNDFAFLRSPTYFQESTEYLGQLTNSELLHDNRRKLTLFNGVRNDLLPPWLRWRWKDVPATPLIREDLPAFVPPLPPEGQARFLAQTLVKLDLREEDPQYLTPTPVGAQLLHQRLPWALMHALTDGRVTGLGGPFDGRSYLGDYAFDDATMDQLRKLSASMTANILAYRDEDDVAPLDTNLAVGDVGPIPVPAWGKAAAMNDTAFLGMERQPFIVEAFVAHVYASDTIPQHPDSPAKSFPNEGATYVGLKRADGTTPMSQTTVVVVQVANPYPKSPNDPYGQSIDLSDYALRVAGQEVRLADPGDPADKRLLPPATEGSPVTAIFYSIAQNFDGNQDWRRKWIEFLDIRPEETAPGTIVRNVDDLPGTPLPGGQVGWSKTRAVYDNPGLHPVELVRVQADSSGTVRTVVVDRIDQEDADPADTFAAVLETLSQPLHLPPDFDPDGVDNDPPYWDGILLQGSEDYWASWARVTRSWGYDFNTTDGIQPDERAPRYVFAKQFQSFSDETATALVTDNPLEYFGGAFTYAINPDLNGNPWFTHEHRNAKWEAVLGASPRRKPTFFNMNPVYAGPSDDRYPDWNDATYGYGVYFYGAPVAAGTLPVPDKGAAPDAGGLANHFPYALQMLQKDRDFQQIGEVLDVWMYGHELAVDAATGAYLGTRKTFSEYMSDTDVDGVNGDDNPQDARVNRLRLGSVIGVGDETNVFDENHAVPDLPAGARVLDLFVCDGPGVNFNPNTDDYGDYAFGNAAGFSGRGTPGLINVNTAPIEVLRTLPHWYKVVSANPVLVVPGFYPWTRLAEATVGYRERYTTKLFDQSGIPNAPDFSDRDDLGFGGGAGPDVRSDRGIASKGELGLLTKAGDPRLDPLFGTVTQESWQIDFAAKAPFSAFPCAHVSTDVIGQDDFDFDPITGDNVSGDVEEANLLLAGASNLITTRSDMFTVYFRVRSFRQNPTTGVWDATNPDYIVDDTRYVMLVDRSAVNHPNDRPKILYLEKLPN